jgi:hypothetical protein
MSEVRQPLVALAVEELVKDLMAIAIQSTWVKMGNRAKEQKVAMVPPQLILQPEVVVHQQRAQTTLASIQAPVVMEKKLA